MNFLNEATFSWFFERHECFQSRIRNSEFLRRNKVQRVSQGVKYSFNHNSVCRKHTVNQTSPWQKQQQRKHFLSFCIPPNFCNGFPGGSVVKNPPAKAGDTQEMGSIPWRRNWQIHSSIYSCLENPRDRGAWWATVHGVTQTAGYKWGTERANILISVLQNISIT